MYSNKTSIHKPIYTDKVGEGYRYFYQITSTSPVRGPFYPRAEAMADASFRLDEDLRDYPEPEVE